MPRNYWSKAVTEHSNALDLEADVSPYRSAMSMLTFYINRAGTHLPKKQIKVLEAAKDALRAEYGR